MALIDELKKNIRSHWHGRSVTALKWQMNWQTWSVGD